MHVHRLRVDDVEPAGEPVPHGADRSGPLRAERAQQRLIGGDHHRVGASPFIAVELAVEGDAVLAPFEEEFLRAGLDLREQLAADAAAVRRELVVEDPVRRIVVGPDGGDDDLDGERRRLVPPLGQVRGDGQHGARTAGLEDDPAQRLEAVDEGRLPGGVGPVDRSDRQDAGAPDPGEAVTVPPFPRRHHGELDGLVVGLPVLQAQEAQHWTSPLTSDLHERITQIFYVIC